MWSAPGPRLHAPPAQHVPAWTAIALRHGRAALARAQRHPASAAAAAARRRRQAPLQPLVCAAATEEGSRGRGGPSPSPKRPPNSSSSGSSSSGSSSGSSGSSSSSSSNGHRAGDSPLLSDIEAATSASELNDLLVRTASQLGGPEVAAALQTAAQRRLLSSAAGSPSGGSSHNGGSSSENGSGSPAADTQQQLAALLVELAEQHAKSMAPHELHASVCALGRLQLASARGAVRAMHALAAQRLVDFTPPALCQMLEAGASLDPTLRSPLLRQLRHLLLQRGMSLELFSPRDLATLARFSGREGGSATEVLQQVVAEARTRMQMYSTALQEHQARAKAAAAQAADAAGAAEQAAAAVVAGTPDAASDSVQALYMYHTAHGAAAAPPPQPPFTPADASQLLAGLASQHMRVGGLVEPMLVACEAQLPGAAADDVARILVSLGELHMDVGERIFGALTSSLAAHQADLSPAQVAAALWSCLRFSLQGRGHMMLSGLAIRHHAARYASYAPADAVCLLWALPHFNKGLPDEQLVLALHILQPELGRCTNSSLIRLINGLGRAVAIHRGRSSAHAGPLLAPTDWLTTPAGSELLHTTSLALLELQRRQLGRLGPSKLADLAAAVALHAPHAGALPAAALAAVRTACYEALAADDLSVLELAHVAGAAARLQWTDWRLVDTLAEAALRNAPVSAALGSTFAKLVWAMAVLAPGRHGAMWAALATAYVGLTAQAAPVRVGRAGVGGCATSGPLYTNDERQVVLAGFSTAAAAQSLPRPALLRVVSTVKAEDVRKGGPTLLAATLALAQHARLGGTHPLVVACCKSVRRALNRMSIEELRSVRASLARMPGSDAAVLQSLATRISLLESQ